MSKVYFATKDDLNNRVNTVNESINTVQSGIDNLDSTALKTSDLTGLATDDDLDAAKSELSAKVDVIEEFVNDLKSEVYQFTINQAESDPASMITYGGKNADYIPAKMNYETGEFEYGSWTDAFFIKALKPCVLGFDGTVVAELNPDDYTKKLDGTSAGITSTSLNGNVMVGIPKTYIKTVTSGNSTTVYIADTKLDDDYQCYAHIDYNEQEQDYAYMSAYEGYTVSNKMRSLSGYAPTVKTKADAEVTAAVANNTNTSIKRWYVETYSMRCLLIYLLMLISKSTDSQTAFGQGRSTGNSSAINTGTMNTKGLFWGSTDGTSGVKVFGIENFWGNIHNRITGMIAGASGTALKAKLCWGTSDGSTTKEYNLTGDGYREYDSIPSTSAYISKMDFTNGAIVPTAAAGGSASTYYCDYVYTKSSAGTYVAFCGGDWGAGASCGSCFFYLGLAASYSYASYGSRSLFI